VMLNLLGLTCWSLSWIWSLRTVLTASLVSSGVGKFPPSPFGLEQSLGDCKGQLIDHQHQDCLQKLISEWWISAFLCLIEPANWSINLFSYNHST
jgi:hypothetical protein